MKHTLRKILIAAGALAIPAAVNQLVFSRPYRRPTLKAEEGRYDWRYGTVRFVAAGQGEPLVLIHDIAPGAGLHEWERLIGPLAKRYRVYALDLLGFGFSDKPDVSYSAYLHITLINDFLKDVVGKPAFVAGSSHGAAYAVMGHSFEPKLYKKLLLVSPTGVGREGGFARRCDLWIRRIADIPIFGTTAYVLLTSFPALRYFLERHAFSDPELIPPAALSRWHTAAHAGGPGARFAVAALLSRFFNVGIESKLQRAELPIRCVWGEKNEMNPLSNYDRIEALNPSIDVDIFEDTKLYPHMENPKAFAHLAVKFFG